jgi:hypothetical protein
MQKIKRKKPRSLFDLGLAAKSVVNVDQHFKNVPAALARNKKKTRLV